MAIENEQKRYNKIIIFVALLYLALCWNHSENTGKNDEMLFYDSFTKSSLQVGLAGLESLTGRIWPSGHVLPAQWHYSSR